MKLFNTCLLCLMSLLFTVSAFAKQPPSPPVYTIQYPKEVELLFHKLNSENIWQDLIRLTQLPNRSAQTKEGLKAAKQLRQQLTQIIAESGRADVSLFTIATQGEKAGKPYAYPQPSIVLKMGKDIKASGVVLGAHLDTVEPFTESEIKEACERYPNLCEKFHSFKTAPGADDDGAAVTSLVEIARTLLNSKYTFKKPIYLIWYAAEEMGLLGSQSVVNYFQQHHLAVAAVMQLDQIGNVCQNDYSIWLNEADTDPGLNQFVANLVTTYLNQSVHYTKCRGHCSDHASWATKNIPATHPFESEMSITCNYYIHTSQDTVDKLTLAHITHFAQLALAFAVELAEPL